MAYEEKCDKCSKVLDRTNSSFGWGRCTECWKCDDCGTRENTCYHSGGVFCESCYTKHMKEKIATFTGDTCFEDDVICPWCGYKFSDSWEFDNGGEMECEDCGNKFEK